MAAAEDVRERRVAGVVVTDGIRWALEVDESLRTKSLRGGGGGWGLAERERMCVTLRALCVLVVSWSLLHRGRSCEVWLSFRRRLRLSRFLDTRPASANSSESRECRRAR